MDNYQVLKLANRRFSEFYLCYCGYEVCKPGHHYGPAVRANYLIHYITKGRGVFLIGSKEYHLHAGQGFLIVPDVQTFYQADSDDPWSYCWLGFDGSSAEHYLNDCGLSAEYPVFTCQSGERLRDIVLEMLQNTGSTVPIRFHLQGLLCEFFSVLSGDLQSTLPTIDDADNVYVLRAVEYIQDHYTLPLHVSDVAKYACITRSYLYTLFQDVFGISPQEFITNYRISRARELLTYTELSVQAISISCGYSNPMFFAKAFKAREGITPTEYRRRNKAPGPTAQKQTPAPPMD